MPFADYEDFDACVLDNGDKDDPEAYCASIKRTVEGAQALSDSEIDAIKQSDTVDDAMLQEDPCWDGYTMVGTKEQNGRTVPNCVPDDDVPDMRTQSDSCPAGQVEIAGECREIPTEDTGQIGPSLSNGAQFALAEFSTKPIEREKLSDTEVVYKNVKILQSGTWTDSGSGETIWYSPRGLQNLEVIENNSINIMHDTDNEVSDVGTLLNAKADDGELFADLKIDTSNSAGAYADENLKQTLETNGAKGFGGPSVEIQAEGQQIVYNEVRDMKELTKGNISGLGLVANPASKPTAFARQTAQRGVALSEARTLYTHESERLLMADPEDLRSAMEAAGIDTTGMSDDEIMDMAQSLHDELMGELTEDDMPGSEEEMQNASYGMQEDEDEDDEEDEDAAMQEGMDEEEEEDMDVMEEMQALKQRMQTLEEEVTQMEHAASEQLSELPDAEIVQELEASTEHIDKRLSALEDKPDRSTRKTMSGDATVDADNTDSDNISFVRDPNPY